MAKKKTMKWMMLKFFMQLLLKRRGSGTKNDELNVGEH